MTLHLYAEYAEEATLVRAVYELRARDYRMLEVYSPYPIHDIDRQLAAPPSRLGVAVAIAGFTALAGAYGLQWLLNGYLYPLDVGGRPPHFPLAFVPISFEMGVLFASLTAVACVVILGRLLRLWHPAFEAEGFESASSTRFWIEVDARDPQFTPQATEELLRATGALVIRRVEVTA